MNWINLDKMHYSLSPMLSYNKDFDAVISAREAGKSSAIWRYATNLLDQRGETTIVIRRRIADITETYVSDIENVINKFLADEDKIKLSFKKGGTNEGIVDVKVEIGGEVRPFFRVVALSNPMARIKSLMYPNLGLMLFDEFICNTRLGEKYLPDEAFKFKEVFNTFQRECASQGRRLRCIFAGNPYSLWNPYFEWWKVDTKKVYPGAMIKGDNYVLQCYELTQELKEHILKTNPLYQFDDSYTKYAFDGRSINDEQIRIVPKLPENYSLRCVFYIEHKKLCVYRNDRLDNDSWYWIGTDENYTSTRRDYYAFDYNQMVDHTVLVGPEEKKQFRLLRNAFRFRKITFKSISESYLFEQIFEKL